MRTKRRELLPSANNEVEYRYVADFMPIINGKDHHTMFEVRWSTNERIPDLDLFREASTQIEAQRLADFYRIVEVRVRMVVTTPEAVVWSREGK